MNHAVTSVVWLKKDLRISDHRPLVEAARRGRVIVLYVYEDAFIHHDLFDPCHLVFINASLRELEKRLRKIGGRLTLRRGDFPGVLDDLYRECPFQHLFSHEETGHWDTYMRDKRVKSWCRERGVAWKEYRQFGVVRPLKSRDGWAGQWEAFMDAPAAPTPEKLASVDDLPHGALLNEVDLDLPVSEKVEAQTGGEIHAWKTLESFLTDRGLDYRKAMSSPVEGWDGCSRISPYLTWGNISMRQVVQYTAAHRQHLRDRNDDGGAVDKRWFQALDSFRGRLAWHCHFIQKLEDQPEIEFENMCRSFDGLRENDFDEDLFAAWCAGQTGYPLVDAVMRCLHTTGWINFRMRAMLVSFASYHLWLDWRRTSRYLARQFLDFEPGIHFSQFQMQSGVTGINAIRIYSPAKQVTDQDPEGLFIKRWVLELEAVPATYLPEPHKMPPLEQMTCGVAIGKDYPEPIVDHKTASKAARDKVWAVKKLPATKEEAQRVYARHGSRRR